MWPKCTILLLFCMQWLHAQVDINRGDVEKINLFYAEHQQFIIESEIVLYANHTTTKRYETERAVMKRKADCLLHRISEIETLTTATLNIAADHDDKKLVVDKQRKLLTNQITTYDLDKALQLCSNGETTTDGQTKICRLEFKSGELEKMEVRFDKTIFKLEKIILFYRAAEKFEENGKSEKPRVEIIYMRQDFNPTFESDLFEESRFVVLGNGKYRPAANYRNYRFFDHTKK